MQTQQDQKSWDRHEILAEIKRRHGTLKALAAKSGVSVGSLSVVFTQPYTDGEQIIALAIEQPLHVLWPDRWDASGKRLATSAKATPQRAPLASQKTKHPRTNIGSGRT